jgi:hypothetical protein
VIEMAKVLQQFHAGRAAVDDFDLGRKAKAALQFVDDANTDALVRHQNIADTENHDPHEPLQVAPIK